MTSGARADRALRLAILGVAAANVALLPRTVLMYLQMQAWPIVDPFFPALLRDPYVFVVAWTLPLVTAALALLRPRGPAGVAHGVALAGCAAALLAHQGAFFFATLVVDFWVGVFVAWLAWAAARDADAACRKAPFLIQLLITSWFLGGAAGKWTPEWWSGEAFGRLTMDASPARAVLAAVIGEDPELWRHVDVWASRCAVVSETLLAGAALVPARAAFVAAGAIALTMWLGFAWDLYEVMWPILGVSGAGLAIGAPPPIDSRAAVTSPDSGWTPRDGISGPQGS